MLGIVLGAVLGLLLVQVAYDDWRTLREYGARGVDFWRYVAVTVPGYLSLVLPVALLVSLLFTLGKLHRANELTALRAAGRGLARITAPVWAVGVLACGLTWWLNSTVVPWSVAESRALRESFQFRKESDALAADRVGAVYSVAFDNARARRMWFFNRYSQFTRRGYGVTVSVLDGQRRETARIVAAEGRFDLGRGWVFVRGRELQFNAETGELVASVPFAERVEETFREDPRLMLLIDRKPVDLSFPELGRLIDYYAAQGSAKGVPYAVRFFSLLADTLAPLIMIAIAIPFATTGVRVNPAVGVSKSLGLFAVYFLLNQLAASLAIKGLVEPQVAAWLPNAGMAAVAAWFFVRMR